ncbi:hypothetical protein JOC95_001107 [Bacillus tianshenii]|uniref:Uncharacterized protein n=1 Tax=Sutcliffiella tianshenii TaxID=1463404 RepID=A0ABS2NXW3_9BACI|nr:hypothetical protein [Bacillus tianshenii]
MKTITAALVLEKGLHKLNEDLNCGLSGEKKVS